MKKIIFLIVFIPFTVKLHAQDNFYFSQYNQVGPVYNPALSGIDNFLDIKLNYRSQWNGFTDAPTTNYFGINGYLQKTTQNAYTQYSLRTSNPYYLDSIPSNEFKLRAKLRHGIGGHVIFDTQGPFEQMSGFLNYALHIPLGRKVKVSLGVSTKLTNQRIDVEKITLKNPNDDTYQALLASGGKITYLDVNPGILIYGEKFYISYAGMNVYRTSISTDDTDVEDPALEHILMTGMQFPLSEKVKLLPSLLYNYSAQYESQWDANVKLLVKERTWAGLSYKSTEAIVFMAGVYIGNTINLSYSYDYVTSELNNYTNGSHEIVLGFMLLKKDTKAPYLW